MKAGCFAWATSRVHLTTERLSCLVSQVLLLDEVTVDLDVLGKNALLASLMTVLHFTTCFGSL